MAPRAKSLENFHLKKIACQCLTYGYVLVYSHMHCWAIYGFFWKLCYLLGTGQDLLVELLGYKPGLQCPSWLYPSNHALECDLWWGSFPLPWNYCCWLLSLTCGYDVWSCPNLFQCWWDFYISPNCLFLKSQNETDLTGHLFFIFDAISQISCSLLKNYFHKNQLAFLSTSTSFLEVV